MRKRTDDTERRVSIAGEVFGESYVLGAEDREQRKDAVTEYLGREEGS